VKETNIFSLFLVFINSNFVCIKLITVVTLRKRRNSKQNKLWSSFIFQ